MERADAASGRWVALDMLKGMASLWVLLIHSEAMGKSPWFYHLVNHAVPIFVVLFGLNAEQWWRRRDLGRHLGEWYRSRGRRLLLPVWGMLPIWWVLALRYGKPPPVPSLSHVAMQAIGYLEDVGTGWFVSLIIQLVVLFPLFHLMGRRLGVAAVLVFGWACTLATVAWWIQIIGAIGLYPARILPARFFGHIAFGMWMAHQARRPGPRAALVAAAVLVPCIVVQELHWAPSLDAHAWRIMDPALTVLLLVLFGYAERLPVITPALVWLGQSSYGIYIGQLIVHNAAIYTLGLRGLRAYDPWLYTLVLLVGAVAFVKLGEWLLGVLSTLWRGPRPVPDLAR